MELSQYELASPVGLVYLVSDGTNLRALDFEGNEERLQRMLKRYCGQYSLRPERQPNDTTVRITAYFDGDLHAVDAIKTATTGSDFQRKVWAELKKIPAGTTVTYGTIAVRIGQPAASRAVGLANGSNPINIVVPCHRVIGANHQLTGYGGGMERKKWLLAHEGFAWKRSKERQQMLSEFRNQVAFASS